jgi:membrane-associated protease RseP (regulator of RpoE activity)
LVHEPESEVFMSDFDVRGPEGSEGASSHPAPGSDRALVLKRETILPAPDRSRVAAVAAMCSLAGIAVGFGLSMFALQMTEVSAPRTRCPRHVRVIDATPIPHPAVPHLGITFISAHDMVGPHDDVGARITAVHRGTPAQSAGLRPGDVVIGYDGSLIDDADELFRSVRGDEVGSRPVLDVVRDGDSLQIVPTLDAVRLR